MHQRVLGHTGDFHLLATRAHGDHPGQQAPLLGDAKGEMGALGRQAGFDGDIGQLRKDDLLRIAARRHDEVELIGAAPEVIDKAEDRLKFKDAMTRIGLGSARSGVAHNMTEAWDVQKTVGFPVVIRPSFTLGGTGGGVAYNAEEFETICRRGLEASPTTELLIEESLLGWKEFEMEVIRDKADNCIIVCSIENLDPMGIHTGDSIP